MIKAALEKKAATSQNTPVQYFRDTSIYKGEKLIIIRQKFTEGCSSKSLCLTISWVTAKAVEVAAEASSNCYYIKNRTDVFPVRCSVTVRNHQEQKHYPSGKFLTDELKVRLSPGSSKYLC